MEHKIKYKIIGFHLRRLVGFELPRVLMIEDIEVLAVATLTSYDLAEADTMGPAYPEAQMTSVAVIVLK